MYVVREVFIAKPGYAGDLAELFKKDMASWKGFRGHVLVDLVTDYNKVVIEYELKSLKEFENMMGDYAKQRVQAKKNKKKPPHVEMYQRGKREIYRIV